MSLEYESWPWSWHIRKDDPDELYHTTIQITHPSYLVNQPRHQRGRDNRLDQCTRQSSSTETLAMFAMRERSRIKHLLKAVAMIAWGKWNSSDSTRWMNFVNGHKEALSNSAKCRMQAGVSTTSFTSWFSPLFQWVGMWMPTSFGPLLPPKINVLHFRL